jgi:guanosine-3',5'-bis(diphosphate) 3'-pyrophosphohydrolase
MKNPLEIEEIYGAARALSEADKNIIRKAFEFAKNIHEDEKRLSGEPYIVHAFETAKILAELQMDASTIAAGLLHDTLDKDEATGEKLAKEFGPDIASLVKSLDNLDNIKYKGDERYAENLRKLFMVTAKDIRVLIVRFAHRLHNVRTLDYLPEDKRRSVALETLEIYAPIANRLGMRKLKGELEDAAFPYVYPKEYTEVKGLLKKKSQSIEKSLNVFYESLRKRLVEENIKPVDIKYRIKQLYSLFRKLEDKEHGMDINTVYDIAALRIIVNDVNECYQTLGIIHNTWTPVPNFPVKDYIAVPKPNGYRSIHTAVFTGDGNTVEIQIRTKEMDEDAEYGIASHLAYAESGKPKSGGAVGKKLMWLKQLIEWQKKINESKEFLENIKIDFFGDRVFAFTPKGDVVDLPENATPIDFAYAIHSDIGDHSFGAKVNGKLVPLDSVLKNGDIVEILTRKNSAPSQKWLTFAKTSLARKHIKMATLKKSARA